MIPTNPQHDWLYDRIAYYFEVGHYYSLPVLAAHTGAKEERIVDVMLLMMRDGRVELVHDTREGGHVVVGWERCERAEEKEQER